VADDVQDHDGDHHDQHGRKHPRRSATEVQPDSEEVQPGLHLIMTIVCNGHGQHLKCCAAYLGLQWPPKADPACSPEWG
jgi:hypothetical protein